MSGSLFTRIAHNVAVVSSVASSFSRGWRGTMLRRRPEQPEQLLELYDMEGCPFCRIAREALCELQLDFIVYPCPKNGTRFRPAADSIVGGKASYPVLVDPNTGVSMPESADIVTYLWKQYAGKDRGTSAGAKASSAIATALRLGRGVRLSPSRLPDEYLELYSFESSPYCRLVRERFTELEIPYIIRSTPKEQTADIGTEKIRFTLGKYEPVPGGRRDDLRELGGRIQVPYLIDPNTGTSMYESREIIAYLDRTYGA